LNKDIRKRKEIIMKAKVDRSGCIGCGLCAEICPEVFRIDDDGLAEAYAEVASSNEDKAIEARDSCPVSVIFIKE
jgi:ferredoxin